MRNAHRIHYATVVAVAAHIAYYDALEHQPRAYTCINSTARAQLSSLMCTVATGSEAHIAPRKLAQSRELAQELAGYAVQLAHFGVSALAFKNTFFLIQTCFYEVISLCVL